MTAFSLIRTWAVACTASVLLAAPLTAQQNDQVTEIRSLINTARGDLARMRDLIYTTERQLTDWEASLGRGATRSATQSNGARSADYQALARQISQHPLVFQTDARCQDDLRALALPRISQGTAPGPGYLAACAGQAEPRIRLNEPLDCASLFWEVTSAGQLVLKGHVKTADDLEYLEAKFGPATIGSVVERPRPVCQALEALELPMSSDLRPAVRMLSNKTRIAFSESLAFEVTTPDFFSFVYLAYLQADGSVVNLLPRRALMRTQYPPNTRLRFGDGLEGRQTYTASAPAGTEAIIAIASRSPIQELEDLESGAAGQYAQTGLGPVDQALFLDLLKASLNDEVESGRGMREISAEIVHLTVVP